MASSTAMTMNIIRYGQEDWPLVKVYDGELSFGKDFVLRDTIKRNSPCRNLRTESAKATSPRKLENLRTRLHKTTSSSKTIPSNTSIVDVSDTSSISDKPSERKNLPNLPPPAHKRLSKLLSKTNSEISTACSSYATNTESVSEATEQRIVSVSFSTIQRRDYSITVGDNVCSIGTPIGLDWEYEERAAQTVDEYEMERGKGRRGMHQMYMPAALREEILRRAGLSEYQIRQARYASNIVRNQRHKSTKWTPLLDAVLAAQHKFKRLKTPRVSLESTEQGKEDEYDENDDRDETRPESKDLVKSKHSNGMAYGDDPSSTSHTEKYDLDDDEIETQSFGMERLEI
eukprot:scaffold1982_cov93-Amphora_coffeaeformis.AAC.8